MEIMREGGGIGFTVEQTKLATDEELLASLVARLKRMLCAGKVVNHFIAFIFLLSFC
jgi:imidazolonepropionase-like amidohydrolase